MVQRKRYNKRSQKLNTAKKRKNNNTSMIKRNNARRKTARRKTARRKNTRRKNTKKRAAKRINTNRKSMRRKKRNLRGGYADEPEPTNITIKEKSDTRPGSCNVPEILTSLLELDKYSTDYPGVWNITRTLTIGDFTAEIKTKELDQITQQIAELPKTKENASALATLNTKQKYLQSIIDVINCVSSEDISILDELEYPYLIVNITPKDSKDYTFIKFINEDQFVKWWHEKWWVKTKGSNAVYTFSTWIGAEKLAATEDPA
jgi:hypothetical protein